MRKLRHYLKSMNYHVYFRKIKDVNNKEAAYVSGHQILTDNQDFINSVTDTNVEQRLTIDMFGKNYIKYTIVDSRDGTVLAKVDNKYNVFTLDDLYIGTIVNHIVQLVCFYALILVAFVTLVISLLMIKSTIKMKVDSEIVISEKDGRVIVDEWNVFGRLKSQKEIYPGKSGIYYFTITNENDCDLSLAITFDDVNEGNVPMRYRLKSADGTYIEENWVTVEQLMMEYSLLEAHGSNSYILEWMWITETDELDTIIGSKDRVSYTIVVNVSTTIIE